MKRDLLTVDLTHGSLQPRQIGGNKVFGAEFEEPSQELVAEANKEAKEKYGGSQHSLANLRPETLVKLTKLEIRGKRKVVLRAQEPKQ